MNPAVVSSILKEGLVVNTRLGSNTAWYANIVYASEENTVHLCLLDSYLANSIMNGSRIILKHADEYFEYLFEGTVSEIRPEYPPYLIVKVHKAEELVNTRYFPRYDIYLPTNIKPVWSESKYFSITTNICLSGIAFISDHEFDYGEEYDAWIFLPKNQSIYARGRIIRKSSKNGLIDYSMQFVDMTEECSIQVSNFLVSLDETTSAMQDDFFNNIKKLF